MTMRVALAVLLASAALASAGQWEPQAIPKRILPVDEGTKEPSFHAFRAALILAARNRQVEAVIGHLATDVRRFEDQAVGDREAFVRHWRLDRDPEPFLTALIQVLEGGGRFNTAGEFVAPYTFTEFSGDIKDLHKYVILIRPDVAVYESPSTAARVVQRLSYSVLPYSIAPWGWYEVHLEDRRGYVRAQDVRQPSFPYAYFRVIDGQWKLAVFVAGVD